MKRGALITGATAGIGLEVARQLSAAGFRVFVTGRDSERLEQVRNELKCPGAAMDLSEVDASERLYRGAVEALGTIDVLVNNAGFNRAKEPIRLVRAEELNASFALNVRAPILLAREALLDMGSRRSGHIVNVISSIVRMSAENYAVYTTMKHALHGFNGCLLKEARAVGVKVTAVYPGGTDTGFRPNPRPDYLRPESAAKMIVDCVMAPADVVVHEILFRPLVESNF